MSCDEADIRGAKKPLPLIFTDDTDLKNQTRSAYRGSTPINADIQETSSLMSCDEAEIRGGNNPYHCFSGMTLT
ncbi:MAG TPA: hypothetical protein VFR08_15900 [Candidatus Angelobacter sp.]|nr:hypothetical protein [Candidatus Angelobacter sp.]